MSKAWLIYFFFSFFLFAQFFGGVSKGFTIINSLVMVTLSRVFSFKISLISLREFTQLHLSKIKRFWIELLLNFTMMMPQIWLKQNNGSLKRGQLLFIRNIIFYKKQYQQIKIKFWKLNVKNRSFCMAYCKLRP